MLLALTDPPENVLINVPSDKLTLVEGANGPRFSCEASGEPQVQYRWFLVKGDLASATSLELSQAKLMQLAPGSISQSSNVPAAAATSSDPIDQVASKALDSLAAVRSKGVNDASGLSAGASVQQNVIELTSSASEQLGGGTFPTISTLDTSNLSLDRRQSGHYICEASNKLGYARQSVYVNVLCK